MQEIVEIWGAQILIMVGVIIVVCTLAAFLWNKFIRNSANVYAHTIIIGWTTGGLALFLCGFMILQVFEDSTGIDRIIGNVLTIAAAIVCLGIGVRAYRVSKRTLLGIFD